jgi:PmbA protein
VESSAIQYPVTEITIAGNLKDMYQHILGVGTDLTSGAGFYSGIDLVEEMTVAGS